MLKSNFTEERVFCVYVEKAVGGKNSLDRKPSYYTTLDQAIQASMNAGCVPVYYGTRTVYHNPNGTEMEVFLPHRVLQQAFIDFPAIPAAMQDAAAEEAAIDGDSENEEGGEA